MKKLVISVLVLASFSTQATRFVTPELREQMNLAQSLIVSTGKQCEQVISFKKYINDIQVECTNNKNYTISHFQTEYIIRQT